MVHPGTKREGSGRRRPAEGAAGRNAPRRGSPLQPAGSFPPAGSSRTLVLGLLLPLFLCLQGGCRREAPSIPGLAPGRGGPEIRVQLATAPRLVVGFPAEVGAVDLEERQPAYRGPLRFPTEVRASGGRLLVGERSFEGGLRILPLGPEDGIEAGGAEEIAGGIGVGGMAGAHAEGNGDAGRGATRRGEWEIPPEESRVEGFRPAFLIARVGERVARRYRGVLELRACGEEVVAVNALALEEYLAGVVGAELGASYPLASLEAQAVASRSYALYFLRHCGDGPVAATTSFQAYRGVAVEHPRVFEALRETRGEVLTYLGRQFCAYYHSTCGGQTARADSVFDEPDIPPLRGVVCEACADAPLSRWTRVLSRDTLAAALRSRWLRTRRQEPIGAIRGLEVAETGPDGRVRYLRVAHDRGTLEWRSDRFRSAVEAVAPGTVPSTFFSVRPEPGGGFRLEGRGWGHGVGMCQMGAARLGRESTGEEILRHYYPGSSLTIAY